MESEHIIRITFPSPRDGYWDGGAKDGGDFETEVNNHPGVGQPVRWGCWALNFYFTCKAGRSWKEATAIAVRWMYHHVRVKDCRIEVIVR